MPASLPGSGQAAMRHSREGGGGRGGGPVRGSPRTSLSRELFSSTGDLQPSRFSQIRAIVSIMARGWGRALSKMQILGPPAPKWTFRCGGRSENRRFKPTSSLFLVTNCFGEAPNAVQLSSKRLFYGEETGHLVQLIWFFGGRAGPRTAH